MAQEFERWAKRQGITGTCRAGDRTGCVVFTAATPIKALAAERAPSWQRLIFARQVLPWFAQIEDLPERDRLTPILAALKESAQGKVFGGVELVFPDSEAGRPLSGFCRSFAWPLKDALQAQQLLVSGQSQTGILYVVFTDWRSAWLCDVPPGLAAPWPTGIPRLKMPRQAPSRAVLKLAEALLVLLTEQERRRFLKPGMHAVDLGAAPGGWSWQLAQHGLHVTAIDNARLAKAVLATGMVEHIAADGFTWRPRRPVDWVVCDMVQPPSRIADLMGDWLGHGLCRHALFNLKLPMKKRLAAIDDALLRLHKKMRSEMEVRVKHLYHDREEVTVYASGRLSRSTPGD